MMLTQSSYTAISGRSAAPALSLRPKVTAPNAPPTTIRISAKLVEKRKRIKLEKLEYNFKGVWFPKGVRFKELHWDSDTDFSHAIFNEELDFSDVEFYVKALFNNASFNARVDFSKTKVRSHNSSLPSTVRRSRRQPPMPPAPSTRC